MLISLFSLGFHNCQMGRHGLLEASWSWSLWSGFWLLFLIVPPSRITTINRQARHESDTPEGLIIWRREASPLWSLRLWAYFNPGLWVLDSMTNSWVWVIKKILGWQAVGTWTSWRRDWNKEVSAFISRESKMAHLEHFYTFLKETHILYYETWIWGVSLENHPKGDSLAPPYHLGNMQHLNI